MHCIQLVACTIRYSWYYILTIFRFDRLRRSVFRCFSLFCSFSGWLVGITYFLSCYLFVAIKLITEKVPVKKITNQQIHRHNFFVGERLNIMAFMEVKWYNPLQCSELVCACVWGCRIVQKERTSSTIKCDRIRCIRNIKLYGFANAVLVYL